MSTTTNTEASVCVDIGPDPEANGAACPGTSVVIPVSHDVVEPHDDAQRDAPKSNDDVYRDALNLVEETGDIGHLIKALTAGAPEGALEGAPEGALEGAPEGARAAKQEVRPNDSDDADEEDSDDDSECDEGYGMYGVVNRLLRKGLVDEAASLVAAVSQGVRS
jgi:hypothetical protein